MTTPLGGRGRGFAPTLEDVAARAGVARATASRVLTGSPRVSPRSRQSVLQAAADLHYTPNHAARALVTRRSDSVAFVVSESDDRFFSDPFFVNLLRGAHREIASTGMQLLFVITSNEAERRKFQHYATGRHLDGAVFISLHGQDPLPTQLEHLGIPVVLSGRPLDDDGTLHYVDADNVGGAVAATTLLVERGARHIGTVVGPQDMSAGRDRLAGWRQALIAAGLRPTQRDVVAGDFTLEGGAAAAKKLMARCPQTDGLFVANDLMAVGAIQTLKSLGRKVPDDVAVVGFDDVPVALVAQPALTTIRQPIEEMGQEMAKVLLDRIAGRPTERITVLPTSVVHRQST
ncbi:MAG: LacI family DNA-binding transcriptional regulator [Actinomycetes bacterium]